MRNHVFISLFFSVLSISVANAADNASDQSQESSAKVGDVLSASSTPSTPTLTLPEEPRKLPVARDGEVIDSVGGGATEAILTTVQNVDGISYITGGVGDEELAEMKAQAANYNVRILITSAGGEYMGNVAVRFLDKDKKEIFRSDNNAGPLFYVNLPAGTYMVEVATESGALQSKKITAPAKPTSGGNVVVRFE